MISFGLNIKPLSINDATKGRHFPTHAKTQYETALRWMLPNHRVEGKWFRIEYRFFLRRFSVTDAANLEKVLTDCIVDRGIIPNDRFVVDIRIRKFPSLVDRIEVDIEAMEMAA